jgi:hypothetical protein
MFKGIRLFAVLIMLLDFAWPGNGVAPRSPGLEGAESASGITRWSSPTGPARKSSTGSPPWTGCWSWAAAPSLAPPPSSCRPRPPGGVHPGRHLHPQRGTPPGGIPAEAQLEAGRVRTPEPPLLLRPRAPRECPGRGAGRSDPPLPAQRRRPRPSRGEGGGPHGGACARHLKQARFSRSERSLQACPSRRILSVLPGRAVSWLQLVGVVMRLLPSCGVAFGASTDRRIRTPTSKPSPLAGSSA